MLIPEGRHAAASLRFAAPAAIPGSQPGAPPPYYKVPPANISRISVFHSGQGAQTPPETTDNPISACI